MQFGGQTPLNLSRALASCGVPIIGTSVDTIEDAEDREKFQRLLNRLGLRPAGKRDRADDGRSSRRSHEGGLPVARAAQLCAGGARDGNLLRPGRSSSASSWKPLSSRKASLC